VSEQISTDFDSPWKEALDIFFEAFLALLFPAIHRQIDWSRKYESLDKEFQQVVREAEVGRRYVDKLVRVWTKAGEERWALVHVEVQTTRDDDFPLRMYVYNYRIFDRYNKAVASIAVLADEDPGWRPSEFHSNLFGCDVGISFPVAKLIDFAANEAELEASLNPFAKIVLAHRKAQETRRDPLSRHAWKLRLVRGLYEQGFSAENVRQLFRLIDWMMVLPPPLRRIFSAELDHIHQEKAMPYISSLERVAQERSLRLGIEVALQIRFGEEGLKLLPKVNEIYNTEQLEEILRAVRTAVSSEDVRKLMVVRPQDTIEGFVDEV
jgi:hypothetical protein